MPGPDDDGKGIVSALIRAAVQLKLKPQIRASFFLGWAIPIALTGLMLPWPYDQGFFAAGAALAVLGVIVLLIVQFTS